MKKIIILMVVMMCVVSGCGARDNTGEAATERETNTGTDMITVRELFDDSKSYNNLDAYIYDGEYIEEGTIQDDTKVNEVIQLISSIELKSVDDWQIDKVECPVYSFYFDGEAKTCVVWCNGYLFTDNGNVYSLDFDFASIKNYLEWDEQKYEGTYAYTIPGIRYISKDDKGWNNKLLYPVKSEETEDNVSGKFVELKDKKITVALTNNGEEYWDYGLAYSLRYMMDEQWYNLPTISPDGLIVHLIGYGVEAGKTVEHEFNLEPFGELVPGKYMIVINGVEIPFEVN